MPEFSEIRRLLSGLFNIETGLSDAAAREIYLRALDNPSLRQALERELRNAFANPATDWPELLFNDQYEVVETESLEEARTLAVRLLWEPMFPNEQAPCVS